MERIDLPQNIRFEVQIKSGIRADHAGSLKRPSNPPCFILNFNDDWNDYGYQDWFALFYASGYGNFRRIGELKIMTAKKEATYDLIKDGFEALDDTFCSVGMYVEYYEKMFKLFGENGCTQILSSLRDCAVNVEVRDAFKQEYEYKDALTRDIDTEKVFREARFIVSGQSMEEAFAFNYRFHPLYNDTNQWLNWNVDFKYHSRPYERYVGLIGENGTGKTQLLKSLISSIVSNNRNGELIKRPIYSCIFAICSTPYDKYDEIVTDDYSIPYICATSEQSRKKAEKEIGKDLTTIFSRGTIGRKSMPIVYSETLSIMLPNIDTEKLILENEDENGYKKYYYNEEYLHDVVESLSSGERHLFLLLSETFANIYLNTLFVLDEPELHLHPKAIIEFMDFLSHVLKLFDSFCVIATHSPLIIREMVSKNVFLLSRKENSMNIGSLPGQTFGEDISKLYHDIFEYDERRSLFTRTVKAMIRKGMTFNDIINQFHEVENLGMNALMTINNLINISRNDAQP